MNALEVRNRLAGAVLLALVLIVAPSCHGVSRIDDPAVSMYGIWSGSLHPPGQTSASATRMLQLTVSGPAEVSMTLDGTPVSVWSATVAAGQVEFLCRWSGHEYRMRGDAPAGQSRALMGSASEPTQSNEIFVWEAELH